MEMPLFLSPTHCQQDVSQVSFRHRQAACQTETWAYSKNVEVGCFFYFEKPSFFFFYLNVSVANLYCYHQWQIHSFFQWVSSSSPCKRCCQRFQSRERDSSSSSFSSSSSIQHTLPPYYPSSRIVRIGGFGNGFCPRAPTKPEKKEISFLPSSLFLGEGKAAFWEEKNGCCPQMSEVWLRFKCSGSRLPSSQKNSEFQSQRFFFFMCNCTLIITILLPFLPLKKDLFFLTVNVGKGMLQKKAVHPSSHQNVGISLNICPRFFF